MFTTESVYIFRSLVILNIKLILFLHVTRDNKLKTKHRQEKIEKSKPSLNENARGILSLIIKLIKIVQCEFTKYN